MPESKQQTLTLYLLSATMPVTERTPSYDEMVHVYAHDEEHARQRAAFWIERHQHALRLEVQASPNGFRLHTRMLPGHITVNVKEDTHEQ
jgi:hypothetical protein